MIDNIISGMYLLGTLALCSVVIGGLAALFIIHNLL
jgi:hypothetical protein